jgi:hypothetical protein
MTQTFRPALIGVLPAFAVALLLALLLSGRLASAIPATPVIDLPGIGTTPTQAPAGPADAVPVIEDRTTSPTSPEMTTPVELVYPALPTTAPSGDLTGPSATSAPGAKVPPPARLIGDQADPWPYPNLPNGKGPLGQ